MSQSNQQLGIDPLDPERCIGLVSEVGTAALTVAITPRRSPNEEYLGDDETPEVAAGDFILVAARGYGVIGQLTDVRLQESNDMAQRVVILGTVQLHLSLELSTGVLLDGIAVRPGVGAKVFSVHPDLVQLIADFRTKEHSGYASRVTISLGTLLRSQGVRVDHTPEMLFGRHCAVLGTSGGGKSWTVARLIEQSAKFACKVVLFDATGEFSTLEGPVHHVHLGTDPEPRDNSTEVVLPYFHLTESDLFAIFKPSGQSQGPKMRAAMKTLKLAIREPELAMDGVIIKVHKSKQTFETAYRRHISYIERNNAEFDISALSRQIEAECVHPNRSALEPQFWGDVNGSEQSACMPLIGRIEDIIHSPHLSSIFFPERRPSLLKAIDKFVADKNSRVLRISLQHLSFAHNCREIICNAIGRHILMRARESKFRDRPLLLMVDEAHQFMNRALEADFGAYSLDSFAQIAKEGRKYGLNVCLSTQRPRDIPDGVLSQVGTFIVHRLINDQDRSVVERASGEASASSMGLLPTLAPGEAVILGVDFPVALTVKIKKPKSEPRSHGPNYQKSWSVHS